MGEETWAIATWGKMNYGLTMTFLGRRTNHIKSIIYLHIFSETSINSIGQQFQSFYHDWHNRLLGEILARFNRDFLVASSGVMPTFLNLLRREGTAELQELLFSCTG